MKFGSLFSGIGGIDLGLERAGMNCVWQVEIDDYATRVLEKHWPEVTRYRDVKDVGVHNLEAVDLICGGFPCQDVSVAGKRAGLNGGRSTLWKEFYRIICELKPKWVLAENVPGLLSSDKGRFFGNILRDLAESGYDAEWNVLSAAAVGAPHRRERVFIVAYSRQFAARVVCAGFGGGWQDASAASVFTTEARDGFANSSQTMADTYSERQQQSQGSIAYERGRSGNEGWWAVEPNVGRVANGIPARVDRLKCLGNAVVPQCAEYIGRMIMGADNAPGS